MIYGQDINEDITAHALARLLLAGPDLPVRIPDAVNVLDREDYDDPSQFNGVGRVTHDGDRVHISGYFVANSQAHGHSQNVSPDYQHFVDEPATA